MSKTMRATLAAVAALPALLLAPAASAQDADCYPVPPEGCGTTDGGTTDGGDTTDGETTDGGTDTQVGATTSGNTDGTTPCAADDDTCVLPTTVDRPDAPNPAPEPPAAAQLPRTGTDAMDWAILAALAIGGGAGAIALTRRETEAVEAD